MKVSISVSKVYSQVFSLTALLGKGADNYHLVAATDDNRPILAILLSEAVSEAEGELHRRLAASSKFSLTLTDDDLTLEFTDVQRSDGALSNLLSSLLHLYAVQYVTAAWLQHTPLAKIGQDQRASAAGYLSRIYDVLCQRERFIVSEENYGNRTTEASILAQDLSGDYAPRPLDQSSMTVTDAANTTFSARSAEAILPQADTVASASFYAKRAEAMTQSARTGEAFCHPERETTRFILPADITNAYAGRTSEAEIAEAEGASKAYVNRTSESEIAEAEGATKAYKDRTSEAKIAESEDATKAYTGRTSEAEIAEVEGASKAYTGRSAEAKIAESEDATKAYTGRTSEAEIAEVEGASKAYTGRSAEAKIAEIANASADYTERLPDERSTHHPRFFDVGLPDGTAFHLDKIPHHHPNQF